MAFQFTLNKNATNHVQSMMYLWQTMVKAGWLVLSYSDGLQPVVSGSPGAGFLGFLTSSTGDPNAAGGTNSANNSNAWIMMQQPIAANGTPAPYSGSRLFTFQRGSSTVNWRVKYSVSGGNVATNGTTTQTPQFGEEAQGLPCIIYGGGTDAAPTFQAIFAAAFEGSSRVNAIADDGVSGSAAPYGFVLMMWPAGGGNTCNSFLWDPMAPGSANPLDSDPYIFYIGASGQGNGYVTNSNTFCHDSNGSASPQGFLRHAMNGQSFVQFGGCWPVDQEGGTGIIFLTPSNTGGNSASTFDDLIPIPYLREAVVGGNTGYKGFSSMLRWNTTQHNTGETLSLNNLGTTRDRIVIDDANMPWDGVTVPLV